MSNFPHPAPEQTEGQDRYERRPRNKRDEREARRLHEGFRLLAGEGVYAEETDTGD